MTYMKIATGKVAISMLEITTTRLPYTEYYQTIRRHRKCEWQRKWKLILIKYTNVKLRRRLGKQSQERQAK